MSAPACEDASTRVKDPGDHQPSRVGKSTAGGTGDWAPRRPLFILGALYFGVAAVTVVVQARGWYIADARFEQFWASTRYLARQRTLWDPVRGLGHPSAYYSPVVGAFVALLHAAGASPWLAERLTHATYLTIGALGAAQVLRVFRPRLGVEHVLAGLFFAFNPFTTQFLVPSGLFLHYALSPWLVYVFLRGIGDPEGWRWPAGFALAVFAVGAVNPASLAYAATPLIPALVYVVLVERSASWRDAAVWVARAAALSVAVDAAALVVAWYEAGSVAQNLATTELPRTINRESSWAESWRGLGSWLTYLETPTGPLRPESSGYLTRGLAIGASFAVPSAAIAALWRSRWRPRLLFGMMLVSALVLMVGLYPVDHPAPFGRLEDNLFQHVLALRSLRNGYKAGGGWALAVGTLLGIGAAGIGDRLAARSRRGRGTSTPAWSVRVVVGLAAAGVIAAGAYPFWNGQLYSRTDRVTSIPSYWRDAVDWLDSQPGSGRVLILPGTTRTRYRWGYTGDDIFDAFMTRPHLVPQTLMPGSPEAATVLAALDSRAASTNYQPGTLPSIARRLGVSWVVLRNDLAWEVSGLPRPSAYTALRHDPGLVAAASFGGVGQNVTARNDASAALVGEDALSPVEIYSVTGAAGPIQVSTAGAPLIASGDGGAWVAMAANGLLATAAPVTLSGDIGTDGLTQAFGHGASVVITDTNRRRATQVVTNHIVTSETLAVGQTTPSRAPPDLFGRPGSQAVATFGDAARITASRFGFLLNPWEVSSRPANAFDADPATAWLVGDEPPRGGDWARADLVHATSVSEVDLTPASVPGADLQITRASIGFSTGPRVSVSLSGSPVTVRFPERLTSFVEVRIDRVEGSGSGEVGFSDVAVPPLDLRETIAAPDDVFRAASVSAPLSALLSTAPTTFLFTRSTQNPSEAIDEELAVRRLFKSTGSHTFKVGGTLQVDPSTPDTALDQIVGGPTGASATARFGPASTSRGALAFDGDFATGWEAPPLPGEQLTLRFPARVLDHVDIYPVRRGSNGDPTALSPVTALSVNVGAPGGPVAAATIAPEAPCVAVVGARVGDCVQHVIVTFPATIASTITVRVVGVSVVGAALGARPIRIAEVQPAMVGTAPSPSPSEGAPCLPLLEVDGAPVAVRLNATLDALLAGGVVPFVGCQPLTLAGGRHSLLTTGAADGLLRDIRLDSGAPSATPPAPTPSLRVVSQSATSVHLSVSAPDGGYLIDDLASAGGWEASLGGRRLGTPATLNGAGAWALPARASMDIVLTYRPQRLYQLALVLSGASVALCLWLVSRDSRRTRRRQRT